MNSKNYLLPLQEAFTKNAKPVKSAQMKKYMLNKFEFFGIQSPERKEIIGKFLSQNALPEPDKIDDVIKALWKLDQREFQYAGLTFMDKLKRKANKDRIELYEWTILQKSWWDTVDMVAGNLIGAHFILYPEQIKSYANKWIDSENIWLQRTAILFQLKYKQNIDTKLLSSFIERLNTSGEFFIQKSIGWILREYSKTNPEWVKSYIDLHTLAPLSKREGLKWINRKTY